MRLNHSAFSFYGSSNVAAHRSIYDCLTARLNCSAICSSGKCKLTSTCHTHGPKRDRMFGNSFSWEQFAYVSPQTRVVRDCDALNAIKQSDYRIISNMLAGLWHVNAAHHGMFGMFGIHIDFTLNDPLSILYRSNSSFISLHFNACTHFCTWNLGFHEPRILYENSKGDTCRIWIIA